ncbi:MAG: pilin [Dyella sp.]|uniref:pilin n=1 Tax=Dyella sp. TaxID=1869338 RepID=UPI003F7F601E
MKKIQQGFTLIELMIVVAIIAILAAIAIPAYQNYLIRAQVSEGAVLADGLKTPMAEFYANTGKFPGQNVSAGIATAASVSGKYVSSTDVGTTTGQITAVFNSTTSNTAIHGKKFILSAVPSNGSIAWTCTKSDVDPKYLPSSCH